MGKTGGGGVATTDGAGSPVARTPSYGGTVGTYDATVGLAQLLSQQLRQGNEQLKLLKEIKAALASSGSERVAANANAPERLGSGPGRLPASTHQGLAEQPKKFGREKVAGAALQRVYCRFNFFNIEEVDIKKKAITSKLYFEAYWEITHEQKEQSRSASEVNAYWEGQWQPKIEFSNKMGELTYIRAPWFAVDSIYEEKLGNPVVCWRTIVHGSFAQHFDLHKFPFDRHKWRVEVMSAETVDRCLLLTNTAFPSAALGTDKFSCSDEWNLAFDKEGAYALPHKKGSAGDRPLFCGEIRAVRKPGFYIFNIGLMMLIIVTLSFTAYGFAPTELADRLDVIMTLVLTAVTFKQMVAESLPDLSYLTFLDKYTIVGIIILTVLALECCAVVVFLPEEHHATADSLAMGLHFFVTVVANFLMFYPAFHTTMGSGELPEHWQSKLGKRLVIIGVVMFAVFARCVLRRPSPVESA